jgi:hypothetical protein
LVEGDENWRSEYTQCPADCDNASHHYAAFFYMGYMFGSNIAKDANWWRDGPLSHNNPPDLAVGNLAADHGGMLLHRDITVQDVARLLSAALDVRSRWVDPIP